MASASQINTSAMDFDQFPGYSDDEFGPRDESSALTRDRASSMDDASQASESEYDYDSDMSNSSDFVALTSEIKGLVIFGSNPAGNRFGTARYIRSVFASTRRNIIKSITNDPVPAQRRRRSSLPDAAEQDTSAKRLRETDDEQLHDADDSVANILPDTQPYRLHTAKPDHWYYNDMKNFLDTYYNSHPNAGSNAQGFVFTDSKAMEEMIEKKAINTAMAVSFLQNDHLLTDIGKFNMEALFTTEWDDDDAASLSDHYVTLILSRGHAQTEERDDWLRQTLAWGRKDAFPGKVVGSDEECFAKL